jgi:hypothetical protein
MPSSPTKTLTVASVNPNSGVTIAVSPSDSNGNGNGGTQFTRSYAEGAQVTLVAPPTAPGGNIFSGWGGCDSVNGNQCTVTMNTDRIVTATYVATVSITVATSPAGLSFTVDGESYSSAQTFTWAQGSSHTIATSSATSSPQFVGIGTGYLFNAWSDGGLMTHNVTPMSPVTYTATFTTQYMLTTTAWGNGIVSLSSGNWYDAGQVVNLQATADAGNVFISWTGPVADSSNAATTGNRLNPCGTPWGVSMLSARLGDVF